VPRVVQVPQLRPLGARVPLAELVPQGEDALFRAGFLLVAPPAAEDGVKAVLRDHLEKAVGLEAVARGAGGGVLDDLTAVDRLLDRGDDEPHAELGDAAVPEVEHLVEVVTGVDVDDGEQDRLRPAGLRGEVQEHLRVLPAGEEEGRPLELGDDLPDDVDRLGLERLEVGQLIVHINMMTLAINFTDVSRRARPLSCVLASACAPRRSPAGRRAR
jgi:hypothetical protein